MITKTRPPEAMVWGTVRAGATEWNHHKPCQFTLTITKCGKATGEFSGYPPCDGSVPTGGLMVTAEIMKTKNFPAMSVVYDTNAKLIYHVLGSTIAEADAKAMRECSITSSCLKLGWAPAGHDTCVIVNYYPSPTVPMKPYMTYDGENPNADALLGEFARAHGKDMSIADFKENLTYFYNSQWGLVSPFTYLDANPQILAP